MSLDYLIKEFLNRTGYLEDDKILAIVFYGSRVRKTNNATSDLDVLIISKSNKNYKAGMVIEGVKIDYNIFSVRSLFDVAYDKKMTNNAYFESVLRTGMIIKNEDEILEQLGNYIEEISSVKSKKKRLSYDVFCELRKLYFRFLSNGSKTDYYLLLELIRTSYNYLKNCSYLSMLKVYDVFLNKEFYEESYSIKLPDDKFLSLFLAGVPCVDFETQLNIINTLLGMLGINIKEDSYYNREECFIFDIDEIKNELIILYNKVMKVMEFLKENHPYADYCYYVLLEQLRKFYKKVYDKELEIDKAKINGSNQEKIELLKEIFGKIDKDFHFDYDTFMLKLKM